MGSGVLLLIEPSVSFAAECHIAVGPVPSSIVYRLSSVQYALSAAILECRGGAISPLAFCVTPR